MVDRIKRYKNHERWPRDWENICREGDEGQLRLDSYLLTHTQSKEKGPFSLVAYTTTKRVFSPLTPLCLLCVQEVYSIAQVRCFELE